MKLVRLGIFLAILVGNSIAQSSKPVTVPITLDHHRIVIDVYLPLPDGSSKLVRAWVDTGSTELTMSRRVAGLFGSVTCNDKVCEASAPPSIVIGGMKIPASTFKAHTSIEDPADVMVAGMSPEINLPANLLRNYDVVFDYANREFTIGEPGSVQFKGLVSKVEVDSDGRIYVPVLITGSTYIFGFDTGVSMSLVQGESFARLRQANLSWPFLRGALGAANMFGTQEELKREVLRVRSLSLGRATLREVAVASTAADELKQFRDPSGKEITGVLGGSTFRNYRIGIDYAHSNVYVEQVTTATLPDMDVVGLTLRPERDGRYTAIGIVDYEGKPSVPEVKNGDVLLGVDGAPVTGATLGQVWSLLGGSPGQTRSLTLERDGKRFSVEATVRRFLPMESKPKPQKR